MQKQVKKHQGDPLDVFAKRCKRNLHLLLFMSPAGPKLRQYIRQYPSLVNCTTIDWFLSWPEEALHTVSNHFLAESNLFELKKPNIIKRQIINDHNNNEDVMDKSNPDIQVVAEEKARKEPEYEMIEEALGKMDVEYNKQMDELQNKVASIYVQMHNAALKLATDYFNEKKRQVYITPTKFIEIFKLFETIMRRKHQ